MSYSASELAAFATQSVERRRRASKVNRSIKVTEPDDDMAAAHAGDARQFVARCVLLNGVSETVMAGLITTASCRQATRPPAIFGNAQIAGVWAQLVPSIAATA